MNITVVARVICLVLGLCILGLFSDWRQALAAAGYYVPPAPPSKSEQQYRVLNQLYHYTNGDQWQRRDNWLGEKGTECSWYGVECFDGKVRRIDLSNNNLSGMLPGNIGDLAYLRWFDLSHNNLVYGIPQSVGNLTVLSDIDLSHNRLSGYIPTSVRNLEMLRQFDLSDNQLSGSIPAELAWLSGVTDIRLQNNQFSGAIPSEFGTLPRLQILNLSGNNLSGSVPPSLGSLQRIKELDLSRNLLSGDIPAGLSQLSTLSHYRVGSNDFHSGASISAVEHEALLAFYLALNGDEWANNVGWGDSPGTECEWYGIECVNGSLEALKLTNNNLRGELPAELFELISLAQIELSNNPISGDVPSGIGNMRKLVSLSLSETDINFNYAVSIATRDALIDLYNNTAGTHWINNEGWLRDPGTECSWYGVSCVYGDVRTLSLNDNNLNGTLPDSLQNIETLTILEVANNNLSGNLPSALYQLPNLQYHNLSGNNWDDLDNSANETIKATHREALLALYESSNGDDWIHNDNWLGEVGTECSWYGVECINAEIRGLVLSENNLTGTLPGEIGNLSHLRWLHLSDNELTGSIPSTLASISDIEQIRLESNQLDGSIPANLAGLGKLEKLHLQNNQLIGSVPEAFIDTPRLADFQIDDNNFEFSSDLQAQRDALIALYQSTGGDDWNNNTGWLGGFGTECSWSGVSCFGSYVIALYLNNNNLSGQLPDDIAGLQYLRELGISGNYNLNGGIPSSIGQLSELEILRLNANSLSGVLPSELKNLRQLRVLDLSANRDLSGSLSAWLGDLTNLTLLSVYRNSFVGNIPNEIGNLRNLRILNIYDNQFVEEIPIEILKLPMLDNFLHDFNVSLSIPQSERDALFAFYQAMGGDEWSNNDGWLGAPGTECEWYGVGCNNAHISSLHLTNNGLSGNLPSLIDEFPAIKYLFLSYNSISGTIPSEIGSWVSVSELYLAGNPLSGTLPESIGNLYGLRELQLSDSNITGEIPSSFGNLTNLYFLDLSGNELTSNLPVSMGSLKSLSSLDISNNDLSGQIPQSVFDLPDLSNFRYEGNKFDLPLSKSETVSKTLNEFFAVTNGQNWPNSYGWDGFWDVEICQWTGITCNQNQEVTGLTLLNNYLSGDIGSALTILSDIETLTHINLEGNGLHGILSSINTVPSELQVLNLQSNSIDITNTATFKQTYPLFSLNIRHNNNPYLFDSIPSTERTALINFYQATNGSQWTQSSGWMGEAGTECSWYGVQCFNGHVETIVLPANNLTGTITTDLEALEHLRELDLSGNQLSGSLPQPLYLMPSLVSLDISGNQFSGNLPAWNLRDGAIEQFDISDNSWLVEIPQEQRNALLALFDATGGADWINNVGWGGEPGTECQWFGVSCHLGQVTGVSLVNNNLSGEVPTSFYDAFSTISELNVPRQPLWNSGYLAQQRNALIAFYQAANGDQWTHNEGWLGATGTECSWYGVECVGDTVRALDLPANNLTGFISPQLSDLHSLQCLSLHNNSLGGALPAELSTLTELEQVLVYDNNISGSLPESWSQLDQVTDLYLFANDFSGQLPETWSAMSSLSWLYLNENNLQGSIPVDLTGASQLRELILADNALSGILPTSIADMLSLKVLDVSGNQLNGNIPDEIGTMSNLLAFRSAGNQHEGTLPITLTNMISLEELVLNDNNLSGQLPADLGFLDKLRILQLDDNQINAVLPDSMRFMRSLDHLGLANNRLSGALPEWLGYLSELETIALQNNNLSGTLPTDISNWYELKSLNIANNRLQGTIPPSLGNLSLLHEVLLQDNALTGIIPALNGLHNLEVLNLARNGLSGGIGGLRIDQADTFTVLDLSANNLSGVIPDWVDQLYALEYLDLSDNNLGGIVPVQLASLSDLQHLYLYGNQFPTFLPGSLDALDQLMERDALVALYKRTKGDDWINRVSWLDGGSVCQWSGVSCHGGYITSLDLSHNNLHGALPEELRQLERLEEINLSGNNLGEIPAGLFDSSVTVNIEGQSGSGSPTQIVYMDGSNAFYLKTTNMMSFYYRVSDNDAELTGLGLRVHFDTSTTASVKFANVFENALVGYDDTARLDTDNQDINSNTDRFISIAWADISSAWPGSEPVKLFDLEVTPGTMVQEGDVLELEFTTVDQALGYEVILPEVALYPVQESFDIDGNGEVTALTDALLVVRHLFGFTDDALVDRAVSEGAVNDTAERVQTRLDAVTPALDVDRNGQIDALTDGLLIMRYAFGFRGTVLIENAIGVGATRVQAEQVETYLSGLVH